MLSSLYKQAQSKNCDICICDYYEVYDNNKVYTKAINKVSDNNKINYMPSFMFFYPITLLSISSCTFATNSSTFIVPTSPSFLERTATRFPSCSFAPRTSIYGTFSS